MKKVLVALLTFVMVVTGFVCLNPNASEVKAATETELSADGTYVTVAKGKWEEDAKGVPVLDGYLFAGYFKEKNCTLETRTSKAGAKYAKFVKEDVLDVKIQITNGTVKSSYETDKNGDTPYVGKHVIRFVSSVDSLDYKNIGFELEFKDADGNVQKLSTKTTKTFKRIASTIGADQSGADTYSFSPKMVSEDSLNFFTAKLPVDDTPEAMATVYKVRAFWTTLDGTVVRGQERAVSVNDTQENVVNMSVKSDVDLTGATVKYAPTADVTNGKNGSVEVIDYNAETGVANVRVTLEGEDTALGLKSATKFVFTKDGKEVSAIYRNYYTSHKGTDAEGNPIAVGDTSWYDVDPTATRFAIASSADLYGLASVVNGGHSFAGDEVHVIKNITVNEGTANKTGTAGWTAATGAETYTWTPIGSSDSMPFSGVLDGDNNEISGLYVSTTNSRTAFIGTANGCELKNFKLTNSYIGGGTNTGIVGVVTTGGIKFENIYSDAVICYSSTTGYADSGAFVGTTKGNVAFNNCWFDGWLAEKSGTFSGIFVGSLTQANVTLKAYNCLYTGNFSSDTGGNAGANHKGTFMGYSSVVFKYDVKNCVLAGKISAPQNNFRGYLCGPCTEATGSFDSVWVVTNTSFTSQFAPNYKPTGVTCTNVEKLSDRNNLVNLSDDDLTQKLPLLTGETESPWVCDSASNSTDRGTPVLKTFASWWAERYQVTPDTSWYNKDDVKSEYVIETAEQLYGLAEISKTFDFANVEIKLGADIELNKANPITVKKWRNGLEVPMNSWTPIGDSDTAFAGTFDGQGHKISGLYYNGTGDYIGLFSYTSTTSKVKNVSVIDSYIKTTGTTVGSVIAQSLSLTVEDVYSNAIIDAAEGFAGGIVGRVYGVSGGSEDDYYWNGTGTKWNVKNAWFDGEIVSYAGKNYFGGIVGGLPYPTILTLDNCLYTGEITGSGASFVGGIVGGNNNSSTCNINNCLSLGTINNGAVSGAAFYGYINAYYTQINVSNSYTTITNYGLYNTKASVRPNHFAVTGDFANLQTRDWILAADEDTILPMLEGETVNAWVNDKTTGWNNTDRGTPILSAFADLWAELEHDEFTVDFSWYDENKDEFKLGTAAELRGFAELAKTHNFAGKTVKLGASIELNTVNDRILTAWKQGTQVAEYNWTPIGTSENPFAGTFDGQGYTISGLYLSTTTANAGLFGVTADTAELYNFKLIDSYMESTADKLGLVGYGCFKRMEKIYTNAILSSTSNYVGGFIGQVIEEATGKEIEIRECWFDGTIKQTTGATGGVGGFVGADSSASGGTYRPNVYFVDCLSTGTVTGKVKVSGFVGWSAWGAARKFENCLMVGEINGDESSNTASFIGWLSTGYKPTFKETIYTTDNTVYGNTATYSVSYSDSIFKTRAELINTDVTALFPDSTVWVNDIGYNEIDRGTPILKHFANWWIARQPETELFDRADTSWYTSTEAGKTYVLDTAAELYGFAILGQTNSFEGQIIQLGADIELNKADASIVETWKNETVPVGQWKPLVGFSGTFDGQGYEISGLYHKSTGANVGLFGTVAHGSIIRNFKLINSYIYANGNVGIIGTGLASTIEKIYTNVIIESTANNAGGIIGASVGHYTDKTVGADENWAQGIMVINECWFDGQINMLGSAYSAGGILGAPGQRSRIDFNNCLYTGTITSERTDAYTRLGGFIGWENSSAQYNFTNCLSVGNYEATDTSYVGGFIGNIGGDGASFTNCYTTYPSANASRVGIGTGSNTISYTNTSEMQREDLYLADLATLFTDASAWAKDVGYNSVDRGTPILATFAEWWIARQDEGSLEVAPSVAWYTEPEVAGEYVIENKGDLLGFLSLAKKGETFEGKTIKLGANITLNEPKVEAWAAGKAVPSYTWTPIGTESKPFAGTFDGDGHTISGIYIKGNATRIGFFGETATGSTISNFRLVDSYIEQTYNDLWSHLTGAIVAKAKGNISNVYSNATIVSATNNVGGITAGVSPAGNENNEMTISNCWFDGSIKVAEERGYVGGIVGVQADSKLTLMNNLFTGSIKADRPDNGNAYIGGIIGGNSQVAGLETVLNSIVSAGHFDIPNGNNKIGAVVGYFTSGVSETDTTHYSFNNVFATRAYGADYTWGSSNGTLTGEVIRTADNDRFIGYIPQSVTGMNEAQQLDFGSAWSMRTTGVPIPSVFADLPNVAETIVADFSKETLSQELGVDLNIAVAQGAGEYVVTLTNQEVGAYTAYLAKLSQELGFGDPVVSNEDTPMYDDGVFTSTYVKEAANGKGEFVVTATYVTNVKEMYITISTDTDAVADTLNDDNAMANAGGNGEISLSMVEDIRTYKEGGVTEKPMTGACFVFQLPNGHFIINDGNTNGGAGKILKTYLRELQPEGAIIIDAWTITHLHNDHGGALWDMVNDAELRKDIYVDAIYLNEQSAYAMTTFTSGGNMTPHAEMILEGARRLQRNVDDSTSPKVYQVHMGERYYFNGIMMDIVNTPEQLKDVNWGGTGTGAIADVSNSASINFMFTLYNNDDNVTNDKKVLLGGDTTQVVMKYIMNAYGTSSSTLANVDVFAAYHHGKNIIMDYYPNDTHISGTREHIGADGRDDWADYLLNNTTDKMFDVMLFPNLKKYEASIRDVNDKCGATLGCAGRVYGDDDSTVYPYDIGERNDYYISHSEMHFTTGYQDCTGATSDTRHGTVQIFFGKETGAVTSKVYVAVKDLAEYKFDEYEY